VTEVGVVELSIMPTLAHQGLMIAFLNDPAPVEDDDAISMANGGESMSNEDSCAMLQYKVKSLLDLRLREWINTGCRFIGNGKFAF
jgi:hypothetical protein